MRGKIKFIVQFTQRMLSFFSVITLMPVFALLSRLYGSNWQLLSPCHASSPTLTKKIAGDGQ
jgi:hypothetical protein